MIQPPFFSFDGTFVPRSCLLLVRQIYLFIMVLIEPKTCAYWSCRREVQGRNYLCSDHYDAYKDGVINKCPECGRYKDEAYDLCLTCWNKHHSTSQQKALNSNNNRYSNKTKYKVEHSKAWDKADEGAEHFFAYILKLDDGSFYVGHTRELRERLSEHRDDETRSIAGRNPRLQYFEVLPTRDSAKLREVELKTLRDKNPRQIRRMIISFQDRLREVDMD
jgi:predicted GIY-YIG superfamily endonuclease